MITILLNISDIHVGSVDKQANEGLVLRAFIEDVKDQVQKMEYDDCFVLMV